MGQQSGHWAFVASVPFAAALVSLLLSISEHSVSAEGRLRLLSRSSVVLGQSPLQQLPDSRPLVTELFDSSDSASTADSGFVLSVPANALLVVGSLDLSGASHRVVFESGSTPSAATDPDSLSLPSIAGCLRLSPGDVNAPVFVELADDRQLKLECADFASGTASEISVLRREADRHLSIEELKGVEFARNPGTSGILANSTTGSSHTAARLTRPALAGRITRNFLVPYFEQGTTWDQFTEGILIAQSARVSVFLDQSLYRLAALQEPRSESPFVKTACEICLRLENGVLEHVTEWIGPVTDLDGDARLTLVITDLDRRVSPADSPVLGCVRDRDFLRAPESDFSGDIVYLDQRLPAGDSLSALLAHEISHAAIFSQMLQARDGFDPGSTLQLPSWLNESIAHLVEGTVAEASASFCERVRQFHENSATSPIVASESHLPFTARRGGSRAAGTLFLQHLKTTPETLRSVIHSHDPIERRLDILTRNSFSESFRTWSVRQSGLAARSGALGSKRSLAQGHRISERLFGTAFCCFRCNGPIHNLRITSDDKAALQITVIDAADVKRK